MSIDILSTAVELYNTKSVSDREVSFYTLVGLYAMNLWRGQMSADYIMAIKNLKLDIKTNENRQEKGRYRYDGKFKKLLMVSSTSYSLICNISFEFFNRRRFCTTAASSTTVHNSTSRDLEFIL